MLNELNSQHMLCGYDVDKSYQLSYWNLPKGYAMAFFGFYVTVKYGI